MKNPRHRRLRRVGTAKELQKAEARKERKRVALIRKIQTSMEGK